MATYTASRKGDPSSPMALLRQELQRESDRGVALFISSLLEEQLVLMLQSFLVDCKPAKELLKNIQFNNSLQWACALGLVTEDEAFDCKLIMRVRNEYAHNSSFGMDFSSPKLISDSGCYSFKLLDAKKINYYRDRKEYRRLFLGGALCLFGWWSTRPGRAKESRLTAAHLKPRLYMGMPEDSL